MKRPTPISTRNELERAAAALEDQIAVARGSLRAALVEAGDTSSARANLRKLEAQASAVSQELAELDAAAAAEREAQVQARAEELATAAADRLEATMNALEPPVAPEVA